MSQRVGLRYVQRIGAPLEPAKYLCPSGYTRAFLDGFETGGFSLWDTATRVEVVTDPVYQGVYACKSNAVSPQYGYLEKSITQTPKIFFRGFFRFGDLDSYQSLTLLHLGETVTNYFMAIYLYNPSSASPAFRFVLWDYYDPDPWKEGTTILTQDTWHKLELEYEIGANKQRRVWVDDNLDIDETWDGPSENIGVVSLYVQRFDLIDMHLDDVVICRQ